MAPAPEGCACEPERGGDLLAGQPAGVEQTLLEALELVREADPVDAGRIERLTGAGAQAALVKPMSGLRVSVLVQERVDLVVLNNSDGTFP